MCSLNMYKNIFGYIKLKKVVGLSFSTLLGVILSILNVVFVSKIYTSSYYVSCSGFEVLVWSTLIISFKLTSTVLIAGKLYHSDATAT
jgi:hypothetical protein